MSNEYSAHFPLWLAARAEGLGVGWVSILKLPQLRAILNIPHHVTPVAYLCIGYPEQFSAQPELEKVGWRSRLPLASVIAYEQWDRAEHPDWLQLHHLTAQPSSFQEGSMKQVIEVCACILPLDTQASMSKAGNAKWLSLSRH